MRKLTLLRIYAKVLVFFFFLFCFPLQDDNEIMCKLLQLLDKSEMLKHKGARMKRVKLVKIQIANIKRKLTLQNKAQHNSRGGREYRCERVRPFGLNGYIIDR